MTVYGEVTYVFYLPQDYDEMKQFEAENDLSIYRRTEDTIAVRYSHKVNATYPYKSKADRKTEPQRNMAEDMVESFGFKAESYRQAKAKSEQTEE